MAWELARPVAENKAALAREFPGARYLGDVGDASHLKRAGDHTWYSADVIWGRPMPRGYVFAQDIGGGSLDVADFARFVLRSVRAGRYPEVKYVISRHPDNARRGQYFGLFDRRFSWRQQRTTAHTTYVHLSFMPGFEERPSTLVADYARYLKGTLAAAPTAGGPRWKKWGPAPALPALPLGSYSRVRLSALPRVAYPPIVPGYGGAESSQAQRDIARALITYATDYCKTAMVSRAEIERQEFGRGFIRWAFMVTHDLAGNPWVNDPVRNGQALGASIGAPAAWGQR